MTRDAATRRLQLHRHRYHPGYHRLCQWAHREILSLLEWHGRDALWEAWVDGYVQISKEFALEMPRCDDGERGSLTSMTMTPTISEGSSSSSSSSVVASSSHSPAPLDAFMRVYEDVTVDMDGGSDLNSNDECDSDRHHRHRR